MKQSTKPQRKAQNKKIFNAPIISTKTSEYDVTCPSCGRKGILKTTLKQSKAVPKTCRGRGVTYKVDISKLTSKDFEKFNYWMDCGMR